MNGRDQIILDIFIKIIAISLYSNEIEIGGPLSSQVHQIALGLVWNAPNQSKVVLT